MGVFKSMRDLQKQAKEIERNSPPVADRMAAGFAGSTDACRVWPG